MRIQNFLELLDLAPYVMNTYEQYCGSGSVCFLWPPGSASGSVNQRNESEDPDPHPDPYKNSTDPQHCLRIRSPVSYYYLMWEKVDDLEVADHRMTSNNYFLLSLPSPGALAAPLHCLFNSSTFNHLFSCSILMLVFPINSRIWSCQNYLSREEMHK